jgi:hypothetical protein
MSWELDAAPLGHPNMLGRLFLGDPERRSEGWEDGAYQIVAMLRNESGKHPDDPRYEEVIERLLELSDEFRTMWNSYEVRRFVSPTWTVKHPVIGTIRTHVFHFTDRVDPTLTLCVLRLADEQSRERITRLLAETASEQPRPERGVCDARTSAKR